MNKEKFMEVLNRELVVALGCTEPIAIAYAAALARKYAKGEKATHIMINASGNVIKNAMSVAIPGTGGSGIDLAAALGVLARDADQNLEVLTGLTRVDIDNAKAMIHEGIVSVNVADTVKKLYIEAVVSTPESCARVVIEDMHTNVVFIEADGRIVRDDRDRPVAEAEISEVPGFFTLNSIWEFVHEVDVQELGIIQNSMELNLKISREGLNHPYGLEVGRTIQWNAGQGFLADDMTTYAMALTAAGSDARMAGCPLPVMSNSGSGNQGISATVPIMAFGEKMNVGREKLIRAVTLSHLVTIYIKSKFGRLSALCGATISATGASCGLAYLLGGGIGEIQSAIQNMLGNVTGMLCDGAKPGCALKIATCTNAAVQSAFIAMRGITVRSTEGIIEENPEKTIDNLCRLGNQGTLEADKIILDIMLKKTNC